MIGSDGGKISSSLTARSVTAEGAHHAHWSRHVCVSTTSAIKAITEIAEAGASDATLMAIAGHISRRMLEHYSHMRMAAKRTALEKLESSLMGEPSATSQPEPILGIESRKAN